MDDGGALRREWKPESSWNRAEERPPSLDGWRWPHRDNTINEWKASDRSVEMHSLKSTVGTAAKKVVRNGHWPGSGAHTFGPLRTSTLTRPAPARQPT